MSDIKTILDALQELEAKGSADDIAAYLTAGGYHGQKACADCPVMNFVRDRCEGVIPSVGWGMQRSRNVQNFVHNFDRGKYPWLVS